MISLVNPNILGVPLITYASDEFNRPDSATLGYADSGELYAFNNAADGPGAMGISSNMAKPDPNDIYSSAMQVGWFEVAHPGYTGDGYFEFVPQSTQANLANETIRAYVRLHTTGLDNDTLLLQSGNGAQILAGRFVAGVYQSIIVVNQAHNKGDRIGLGFYGTALQLYRNRVALGAPGTAPNNFITARRIGIAAFEPVTKSGRVDSWGLYNRVPS